MYNLSMKKIFVCHVNKTVFICSGHQQQDAENQHLITSEGDICFPTISYNNVYVLILKYLNCLSKYTCAQL